MINRNQGRLRQGKPSVFVVCFPTCFLPFLSVQTNIPGERVGAQRFKTSYSQWTQNKTFANHFQSYNDSEWWAFPAAEPWWVARIQCFLSVSEGFRRSAQWTMAQSICSSIYVINIYAQVPIKRLALCESLEIQSWINHSFWLSGIYYQCSGELTVGPESAVNAVIQRKPEPESDETWGTKRLQKLGHGVKEHLLNKMELSLERNKISNRNIQQLTLIIIPISIIIIHRS